MTRSVRLLSQARILLCVTTKNIYGMKLYWRDRDSLLFVGGMWDIENFSGGIRDEIIIVLAGPGFVTIRRQDVGY